VIGFSAPILRAVSFESLLVGGRRTRYRSASDLPVARVQQRNGGSRFSQGSAHPVPDVTQVAVSSFGQQFSIDIGIETDHECFAELEDWRPQVARRP